MTEPRPYVVVLFGGSEPDYCSLSKCPSSIHGPFATRAEARAYADRLPEG